MDVLEIVALVAAVIGIIGSVVPALPGPPVSWLGILALFFVKSDDGGPVSLAALLCSLAAVVVVTVLDYVVPAKLTSVAGGHKAASRGALLGMVIGIFFTPLGMLAGSLLGAFVGELSVPGVNAGAALKASLAVFAGFILSTGLKLVTTGAMAWYIFAKVF